MGLKKVNRKKGPKEKKRIAPGSPRARAILDIVQTDSTFSLMEHTDGSWSWLGQCIHCNSHVSVSDEGVTSHTIEHIYPRCKGGSVDDPRNLALACERCNSGKGVRHDRNVGKGGRSDDVVRALQRKREERWRNIVRVEVICD